MSRGQGATLIAFGTVIAAIFAGKALAPDGILYRELLTEGFLMRLGGITKLVLLVLAWWSAARIVRSLEAEHPARGSWRLLSLGLLCFCLGQAVLSAYQVTLGESPYPSVGDVFFLAAYPPLVIAAIGLIRAYRDTGYPVGTASELAGLVVGLGAAFAVVGSWLLQPILTGDAPLLERLLTAAYPALDFVLLIPVLLLLRISSRFRGGRIFRAWAALLAGLIALCAADILYAYFSVMEQPRLEPLVDATYVLSYLLLALGTAEQRRLLAT